jgi:tRNA 2-thiouridine synthesizing protein E
MFAKAVQKQFGEDKGNSRYLHLLFPNGPVRYACLIAGLPKPPGCW